MRWILASLNMALLVVVLAQVPGSAVAQEVVIVVDPSSAEPGSFAPQPMRMAWETVATEHGTGARQSIPVQVQGPDGWRVVWALSNNYVGPRFHPANGLGYVGVHVYEADTGRLVAQDSSTTGAGVLMVDAPPGRYRLRVFAYGAWSLQVQEPTPGAAR